MTGQSRRLGAATPARRIAAKQVPSPQVAAAHLARTGAVNAAVTAVTAALADDATKPARVPGQAAAAGDRLGPLHGVPATVKDNPDIAGNSTTCGAAAFRDNLASAGPPAVARLRAAGPSRSPGPICRTWRSARLPATRCTAPPYNPRNPALTPGGSSGGQAVTLATSMSPPGLGNDLAGPARLPAQYAAVPTAVPGGIPHGAQIIGPYQKDKWRLAAGAALEQRLGTVTPTDHLRWPTPRPADVRPAG